MSATEETLDARLARLERQSRRLRGLLLVVAALVVVLLVLQRRPVCPGGVVEAEKFVVVDRAGRTRAVLGPDYPTSPEHSPIRLALYNDAQRASAVLYLSDAFAGLSIRSGADQAERRIHLFANPKDGAGLSLASGHGRNAVQMSADAAGAARIVLQDASGTVVFRAP
jgi:hypothetical protein